MERRGLGGADESIGFDETLRELFQAFTAAANLGLPQRILVVGIWVSRMLGCSGSCATGGRIKTKRNSGSIAQTSSLVTHYYKRCVVMAFKITNGAWSWHLSCHYLSPWSVVLALSFTSGAARAGSSPGTRSSSTDPGGQMSSIASRPGEVDPGCRRNRGRCGSSLTIPTLVLQPERCRTSEISRNIPIADVE